MISNKRFIFKTIENDKKDKSILDRSLGFNYKSVKAPSKTSKHLDGWHSEKINWYTLYTGLFLMDTFRISKKHAIDIGGFKGFYSSVYARHFDFVDVFEANPYAYTLSKLNFKRQELTNVTLHNKGCWSKEESIDFYCKFYDKEKTLITGQSTPIKDLNQEEGLITEKIKTSMVSIDSFNFQPSFIKIDAEGSEVKILEGSINTLKVFKPFLQIENDGVLENNSIIDYLLIDLGYSKIDLNKYSHLFGNLILCDSYYIDKKLLSC